MMNPMRFQRCDGAWIAVDGRLQFALPLVLCEYCDRRSGAWSAKFPALRVPRRVQHLVHRDQEPVFLEKFREIRDKVERAMGTDIGLPPLSQLGQFSGKLLWGECEDIEWAGVDLPLISKKALKALSNRGIQLTTGVIDLVKRKKKITTHVAIQCDIVPMLAPATIKGLGYKHCKECGNYYAPSTAPRMRDYPCQFVRACWPEGEDLVRLGEWPTVILASERFVEAVNDLKLTGYSFVEFGKWV
ncbi:MAG TPA: double-CXXCG motif protein [Verrucomicrobiae bacterium]|jgi:hypothetical protein